MNVVDVVVPVFKGYEQTRRCIESVLDTAGQTPFELIVVDDCTPEAAISAYLDGLGMQNRIKLLRNTANAGFVQSVNRGMDVHRDRDVILLNSDTEVANDWIDRLRASAYSDSRVATVTPFSNNATICTYPFDGWREGLPGSLGLQRLDKVFATALRGRSIDLPTAVGFCMYLRRAAIEELGLFDAQRYGRGYGEENDYSRRAAKAGWRNLLACDVFVFHEGSVSFSQERVERVKAATDALLQVHPEYAETVYEFIIADPAEEARRFVDRARVLEAPLELDYVLRERGQERRQLLQRVQEADRYAADRGAHAVEVHHALDRASALVEEREREVQKLTAEFNRTLSELGAEIAHLRSVLSEAETVAATRAEELRRIRSTRAYRLYRAITDLLRRPPSPA